MSTRAEKLKSIVDDAWAATKTLEGEDSSVRYAAFESLLKHLLTADDRVPPRAVGAAPNGEASESLPDAAVVQPDASYETAAQRAEAVARYFDIAPDEAKDLFNLSEPNPRLQMPKKQMAQSRAGAVRKIALLICGARTALGLETGSVDIREAVDEYDQLDTNFMKTLTEMPEIVIRGKPHSKNRQVRVRVIGAEKARELAAALVG